MANKSLTDLTARTATADSDLLHINSGGTDYKETKANFSANLAKWVDFGNSSALTTQIDALAGDCAYEGIILSYGHQTETGVPINANFYVDVIKIASGAGRVKIYALNSSAKPVSYINFKSGGTWQGWVQDPTRDEITSLNNSLTNWVYLQIGSNTYGILKCRYNTSLKLCQMQWSGNGQTPGTTQYSFNLPSSPVLTPNFNSSTPLRNGDLMEVRTDGTVRVGLTGMDWSGGSIMYSIQ